jgi:hypothetical protein
MPANYVLLEKITVGAAGASSVTFSGIPQTGYTDLVVKASVRDDVASSRGAFYMTFNGSSANNYSWRELRDVDGTASSTSDSVIAYIDAGRTVGATSTGSTFNNVEIYIPNYAGSTAKSASIDNVLENNAASVYYSNLTAGLWSLTNAITSIGFTCTGNFVQYSTFYLYGVAKLGTTPAIGAYATGGDVITTDGNYWYHTFNSSGTFTPRRALTCDYLVVAGGGGGGDGAGGAGGGGGAGGLRSTVTATGGSGSLESALSLTAQAYTVTIGAGGPGVVHSAPFGNGTNGSNSVFATITSTGGGGGGGYSTATSTSNPGNAGGSGGGGADSAAGGSNTPSGQGFAGSTGSGNPNGGGGGGASELGGTNAAGYGGDGVAVAITGSSVTYAGGGGAGATVGQTQKIGGSGGGGNGQVRSGAAGTAGTANLGGGGGGSSIVDSYAGGSGIVIVRYPI